MRATAPASRRGSTIHNFTIVIPVKGVDAKSRLDHPRREQLARAMALDTVEAALAVAPVIVVTDGSMAVDAAALGATVVPDPGLGLNAAIEAGIAVASTGSTTGSSVVEAAETATAVLLGDIPGLAPSELAEALEAAGNFERAMVADADGTGTVLVVAGPGIQHRVAFGLDSQAAHLANGYTELLEPWVTLRRDIDRVGDLAGAALGPRTAELLGEQ